MVKRHNVGYGMAEAADSPTGKFVLAADFDRMRRRLVVKLLQERSGFLTVISRRGIVSRRTKQLRWAAWCQRTLAAITRNEPLEYFNRLGQDKP